MILKNSAPATASDGQPTFLLADLVEWEGITVTGGTSHHMNTVDPALAQAVAGQSSNQFLEMSSASADEIQEQGLAVQRIAQDPTPSHSVTPILNGVLSTSEALVEPTGTPVCVSTMVCLSSTIFAIASYPWTQLPGPAETSPHNLLEQLVQLSPVYWYPALIAGEVVVIVLVVNIAVK